MKGLSIKGNVKAGAGLKAGVEFLGIDLVSAGAEAGRKFDGELSDMSADPFQFCLEAKGYNFLTLFAQVGPESFNVRFDNELINASNSSYKANLHFEETGLKEDCTRGSSNYEGVVKRADDPSVGIHGAKIQIYKGSALVDTTYTEHTGKFVGIKLKSGGYTIKVSAAGFAPYQQKFEIIGGQTTYIETQLMIDRSLTGQTVVCSGIITNAYTGEPVPEAEVKVYALSQGDNTEPVTSVKSGEDGKYSFQAQAGNYQLVVTKEEFIDTSKYISVTADKSDCHISLNPKNQSVGGGNLRAVLTWGQQPHDLDSHLVGPSGDGKFHVYHANMFSENARACFKIAFWQMCVTLCGRFGSDEGGVAGYAD